MRFGSDDPLFGDKSDTQAEVADEREEEDEEADADDIEMKSLRQYPQNASEGWNEKYKIEQAGNDLQCFWFSSLYA